MKKLFLVTITLLLLTSSVWGASQTFQGNVTGNAATVTTNANLTGDVTSVGNATTIKEDPAIKAVTLNPGNELVTNGDMEAGVTGWNAVLYMATLTEETGTKHAGAKSLKVTAGNPESDTSYFGAAFATVSGHKYIVSSWMYNPTAGSATGFSLRVNSTADLSSGPATAASSATKDAWVNLTHIFTASGATSYVGGNFTGVTGVYIYADDFSVTEVPLSVSGDAYLTGNARVVIPTFANNAAAIAGGLVAGQFYRVNAATDPEPLYIVH